MLSTESSGTGAQHSAQNVESDGTDKVQKKIRKKRLWGCLRILFDAIEPPDGDIMHPGPSKRGSGQCNGKTKEKLFIHVCSA